MSKTQADLLKMPSPLVFNGQSADPFPQPPAEKVQSLAEQLQDLKDIAMKPAHTMRELLIGHPEKLFSDKTAEIKGPGPSSLTYPEWVNGAVDTAMALPLFGGVARGGLELAGGTIREMKPFFSQLARTLAERLPERASTEQILNIARKGSKAEELAYSGLENFLKPGQKYMKGDVMRHLEKNAPELHERMVGGKTAQWYVGDRTFDDQQAAIDYAQSIGNREMVSPMPPTIPSPKFTRYTLPGGENHRELMVTLPTKKKAGVTPEPLDFGEWVRNEYGSESANHLANGGVLEDMSEIENEYERYLQNHVENRPIDQTNYSVPGGHAYGDPELDVNRLFHLRMTDRDLDRSTGRAKTLFMEELQSDWHQAARQARSKEIKRIMKERGLKGKEARLEVAREVPADFGYSAAGGKTLGERYNLPANYDIERDNANGYWILKDDEGNILDTAELEHAPTELDALELLIDNYIERHGETAARQNGFLRGNAVPDAPFKTTWQDLGMKRMLQEAAAGGYERLAWTTGEQQADRYSLMNHGIFKLEYDPKFEKLKGYNRTGEEVLTQRVKPDDLHELVGEDLADRLTDDGKMTREEAQDLADNYSGDTTLTSYQKKVNDDTVKYFFEGGKDIEKINHELLGKLEEGNSRRVVEGDNLKVGGQGMVEFYDKMIPRYMEKFGKKFGVKVERHEMTSPQKGFKYLNGDTGEELSMGELDRMINGERDSMLEMSIEDIRGYNRKELEEHLGITPEDLKPAGQFDNYDRYDLANKINEEFVQTLSPEGRKALAADVDEMLKNRHPLGSTSYPPQRLIDKLHGLNKSDLEDLLIKHMLYTKDDFAAAGRFAGADTAELRDFAIQDAEDSMEAMSDREIKNSLMERDLIKEVSRDAKHEVWSMKMTPEMRKAILSEGQPLFAKVPPIPHMDLANRTKSVDSSQPTMMPAHRSTSAPRQ